LFEQYVFMFQDIINKKTINRFLIVNNIYDRGFRDDLIFAFAIQKKKSVQLQVDDFYIDISCILVTRPK